MMTEKSESMQACVKSTEINNKNFISSVKAVKNT